MVDGVRTEKEDLKSIILKLLYMHRQENIFYDVVMLSKRGLHMHRLLQYFLSNIHRTTDYLTVNTDI